jgi:hypothetical protein
MRMIDSEMNLLAITLESYEKQACSRKKINWLQIVTG